MKFALFYRALIIENFIPPSDKNKIMNRARYDDDEDVWSLESLSKDQYVIPAFFPDSSSFLPSYENSFI